MHSLFVYHFTYLPYILLLFYVIYLSCNLLLESFDANFYPPFTEYLITLFYVIYLCFYPTPQAL